MAHKSKRHTSNKEMVSEKWPQPAPLVDAIATIKEMKPAKFDETVELAVQLGVDPRKAEEMVRGTVGLPGGTGKDIRVAVFAQGEAATAAREAGADLVGADDLAEQVEAGTMDFDLAIATPDMMGTVGRLGRVLGPRGLMPNPKTGTVTPDVETAVKNAKAGQIRYRTDKNGIIHGGIGKISFELDAIKGNLEAVLADLQKAKPAASKGIYMKKVTLSTTMGPGVIIDQASIEG